MVEHLGERPNLRMDELAEMTDLRPRFEKEIWDTRGKNRIYFFSVDGTLRGTRFTGCLFAGECILVQAESFEAALKLAKDGLNDTPQIARDYFEDLERSVVVASQPALATDPKLKAMIEHAIGKKPWPG